MVSIEKTFYSNDWKYPIDKFAHHEKGLKVKLRKRVGSTLNFPKLDWERACSVTDNTLEIILTELRNQAKQHYEGLKIRTYLIRQASARQGLKIDRPDEFDFLVPFEIEGLHLKEVSLTDISERQLAGQIRLRVEDVAQLERFPSLKREGVFEFNSGTCFINTNVLQEYVFKSLLDKALHNMNLVSYVYPSLYYFLSDTCTIELREIYRGSRPPTLDLEIDHEILGIIAVDFVPALILSHEKISIPGNIFSSEDKTIKFYRYGLMKWVNKRNTNIDEEDKNFIWRSCSSYERCMFDLCDGNEERSYIRTACRVMKALVLQLRTRPNQAAVLLSSYHLKTIAMYCILLLTVPSKLTSHSAPLNGVREALGYFLTFLDLVLEKECLPDFFLGNEYLNKIFPGSYFSNIQIKYNLFDKEDPAKVKAAKHGLPEMKNKLAGCFEFGNLNPKVITFFREKTLSV